MRSNCIIAARLLVRRLQRRGKEVYTAKRFTRLGKRIRFKHYLVMWRLPSGYLHTVSFKPLQKARRWFPPLLFPGALEWGDWPDTELIEDAKPEGWLARLVRRLRGGARIG